MNVLDTAISGVKIIEPKVFGDARGYFFEVWRDHLYREAGIDCNWVQDNESCSVFGVPGDCTGRRLPTRRRSWSG